jgi:hypothetical protein
VGLNATGKQRIYGLALISAENALPGNLIPRRVKSRCFEYQPDRLVKSIVGTMAEVQARLIQFKRNRFGLILKSHGL